VRDIPSTTKLRNGGERAVYVNIEPVPDRYLLKPGEKLQFFDEPSSQGFTPTFTWLGDEVTIWPETEGCGITLIDGLDAQHRSWSE
jgi:hypothetical protein